MMTNSVNNTFDILDLSRPLLMEACEGQGLKFLNYRRVSHLWKAQCEKILSYLWDELRRDPPKGMLDLSLLMGGIEDGERIFKLRELAEGRIPDEHYMTIRFRKLADASRFFGAEISSIHTPLRIPEFQLLQDRISYNKALRIVWSRLRLHDSLAHAANIPPLNASATEIRKFFSNPTDSIMLSQIDKLDLSNLKLRIVPPELRRLDGLIELDLSRNQLTEVPDLLHFKYLEVLKLSHNQLKEVSDFACFRFDTLDTLDLSHNQLKEVSDFAFVNLPCLQALNLAYNQLEEIPNLVLSELEKLYLEGNQLKNVSNLALPDLTVLWLAHNQLNEIPNLANFQKLKKLTLFGNTSIFIPDGIATLEEILEMGAIQSLISQLNYPCQSSLATLYQAILSNKLSQDQIQEIFNSLDEKDKSVIFEMVWEQAGKPDTDGLQWGKEHAFDGGRHHFGLAVQKAIMTKLECLSQEQRSQVYSEIYHLAGGPQTDAPWGELQAKENLPRLADALSRL
jgi:Leucine-rich repeat (LRR) protein